MNEVVIPLKITGIAQMKAELRELKGSIANATDPAQMAALAQQAGVLTDKIKDANDAVNIFASGSKFEQVSNGLGGIRNSLMSLDFEEAAEKSKVFATALGGINKADIAKSFKGIADMTGTLSKAFLKLGATILMNPIFLIVAAVVAIIAIVALVLKSFGKLDDVIKALMAPINALIAGFKAMTDWLGLTSFAAEENAEKTAAANKKVSESSKAREVQVVGDLGREVAQMKSAGEDATKQEEAISNTKIKEANVRKAAAKEELEAVKLLDKRYNVAKLDELKKQIDAENEIIKQATSDKIVAKNTANKKEVDALAAADKESIAKQKAINDKYAAADKASMDQIAAARKIVTDSAKSAQQIELDDLKAAYTIKIAEATKYKNDTTALLEAQGIQEEAIKKKYTDQANANQLALDATNLANLQAFESKQLEIKNEAKAKEVEAAEYAKNLMIKIDQERLQQKQLIEQSAMNLANLTVNFLQNIAGKNKGIQKAAIIAENAIAIAKMVMANNAANAGALATPQAILTSGASAIPVIAMNNISTALGIAATIAATSKALSVVGGGSAGSSPNQPGTPSGGGATTAVAPAAAPQLFGQANTGSQINAGGGSNNITVTAVVSETEMTATQHFINNIQKNSVL